MRRQDQAALARMAHAFESSCATGLAWPADRVSALRSASTAAREGRHDGSAREVIRPV
jgi:hypothetical protein